jgi:hypothetical protein
LFANNRETSSSNLNWPKVTGKKSYSQIGFEVMMYGSVQRVDKTLSTTKDWDNYIMHRKNEEEPILTPSIGIAFIANRNSFSLSLGAEYSMYGEKTNYYPYSNQITIIGDSDWQTYLLHLVDTDTAYVTGNQWYIETPFTRLDSSLVQSWDTLEEYKYDKRIAESNGINKFYFIEVPVEVSYCITKGRAGFGISAGISPGMLVHEKGHYLRSDGRGIESFQEIQTFRKFMMNARLSADFYYRLGARTKLVMRPQFRTNLNSVFKDEYGIKQKYYSTGVLFGISYMLN